VNSTDVESSTARSSSPTALIAGLVVAGLVLLMLVVLAVLMLRHQRQLRKRGPRDASSKNNTNVFFQNPAFDQPQTAWDAQSSVHGARSASTRTSLTAHGSSSSLGPDSSSPQAALDPTRSTQRINYQLVRVPTKDDPSAPAAPPRRMASLMEHDARTRVLTLQSEPGDSRFGRQPSTASSLAAPPSARSAYEVEAPPTLMAGPGLEPYGILTEDPYEVPSRNRLGSDMQAEENHYDEATLPGIAPASGSNELEYGGHGEPFYSVHSMGTPAGHAEESGEPDVIYQNQGEKDESGGFYAVMPGYESRQHEESHYHVPQFVGATSADA
jgi:hypothetical protein